MDKDLPLLTMAAASMKGLAKSKTARRSLILFFGNVLNSTLALLVAVIVSRSLGPERFGIIAIYSAIWITLVGLTDFGLGTTAIKYISANRDSNPHRAALYMKVILKLELATGVLVGLVGLIFSGAIAETLGGSHLLFAVRMAFVAGVFGSVGAFITPFLVSFDKYLKSVLVQTIGAVFRLAGVLAFLAYGLMDTNPLIILYSLVSVVVLLIGFVLTPKNFTESATSKEQNEALIDVFRFSKWIFLSYLATVTIGKIDVFLLSRYKGSTEVGLYAAAQQLTMIILLLLSAISTVLMPVVSTLKTRQEYRSFIKKVFAVSLTLAIMLLPIAYFGEFFVTLIFGERFSESFGAFRILFSAYLVSLIANPTTMVLYGLNKPGVFTAINFGQLLLAVILNLLLIPPYGKIGSAAAFFIVTLIGASTAFFYSVRAVSQIPETLKEKHIVEPA